MGSCTSPFTTFHRISSHFVVARTTSSPAIAARTLACVADVLGSMAGEKAGLRSGPARNEAWTKAFKLLEVRIVHFLSNYSLECVLLQRFTFSKLVLLFIREFSKLVMKINTIIQVDFTNDCFSRQWALLNPQFSELSAGRCGANKMLFVLSPLDINLNILFSRNNTGFLWFS